MPRKAFQLFILLFIATFSFNVLAGPSNPLLNKTMKEMGADYKAAAQKIPFWVGNPSSVSDEDILVAYLRSQTVIVFLEEVAFRAEDILMPPMAAVSARNQTLRNPYRINPEDAPIPWMRAVLQPFHYEACPA